MKVADYTGGDQACSKNRESEGIETKNAESNEIKQ